MRKGLRCVRTGVLSHRGEGEGKGKFRYLYTKYNEGDLCTDRTYIGVRDLRGRRVVEERTVRRGPGT